MTDAERAACAVELFNHDHAYVIHREVVRGIIARECAAVRLDERRAIVAWIRGQVLTWGRSTVRTIAQQIADRIERGEHEAAS